MTPKDIIKITVNLVVIYLAGGLLLAAVYARTSPVIYLKNKIEKEQALQKMVPGADAIVKLGDWHPHEKHAEYYTAYGRVPALLKGQAYRIVWESRNVEGCVNIVLYRGDEEFGTLADCVPDEGGYTFTPEETVPDGNDYRIGISAMDGAVSALSKAYFAIAADEGAAPEPMAPPAAEAAAAEPAGPEAPVLSGITVGRQTAYIVQTFGKGYSSYIDVLFSVDTDFRVQKIDVLHHAETPGLGDEIELPYFKKQFEGKDAEHLTVKKTETTEYIQAITGATISTRAVAEDGVRKGIEFLKETLQKGVAEQGAAHGSPEG